MTLFMFDEDVIGEDNKITYLGKFKDPENFGIESIKNQKEFRLMMNPGDEVPFSTFILIVPDEITKDKPIVALDTYFDNVNINIVKSGISIECSGYSLVIESEDSKNLAFKIAKSGKIGHIHISEGDNLFKAGYMSSGTFITAMSVLKDTD